MNTTIPPNDIHRLLRAEHDDPFGVLGLHQIDKVWVVRCIRPDAKELAIVDRHHVERRFPQPASQRKAYLKPNWQASQRPLTICYRSPPRRERPSRLATPTLMGQF